jgi:uncharacterized C2H2 Zn-finger protein
MNSTASRRREHMAQLSCCGVEFKNEEELARHQAKAHGQEKRVVGKHCDQEFYTQTGLQEHMRMAHGKTS